MDANPYHGQWLPGTRRAEEHHTRQAIAGAEGSNQPEIPLEPKGRFVVSENTEIEVLTAEQIRGMSLEEIQTAITRVRAHLTVMADQPATLATRERQFALTDFLGLLQDAEAVLAAPAPAIPEPPAPVPEPVAEEPTPEPEPAPVTDDVTDTEEVEVAVLEPVAAALNPVNTDTQTGPVVPASAVVVEVVPELLISASPVHASLNPDDPNRNPTVFNPAAYTPQTFAGVADRIRQLRQTPGRYTVATVNRLGALASQVPRMLTGDRAEDNTRLLNAGPGLLQEEFPAVHASLCGDLTELPYDPGQCDYRSDTPFMNSFGNVVLADSCGFKWRTGLVPTDFDSAATIWHDCKQALVDPANSATWKPVSPLPACAENECMAKPFYVTWGLAIEQEDLFCRPDVIEEAHLVLQAYRAKRLEEAALYLADKNSRAFTDDIGAYTLGLSAGLGIALARMFEPTNATGRLSCNANPNLTAFIPEHFLRAFALDMWLSEANGTSALAMITDLMSRIAEINNVVVIRDWGCEGQLVDPYATPGPDFVCDFDCTTEDLAAIDCTTLGFGLGEALPMMSNAARIRFIETDKWHRGETGVVDYDVARSDVASMRQNSITYFGESRHFLFPRGGQNYYLDLTYCVNGQRIDPVGALDCTAIQAAPSFAPVVNEPVAADVTTGTQAAPTGGEVLA